MSLIRLAVFFLVIGLFAGMLGFGGFGSGAFMLAKLAFMALMLKFFFIIFVLLAGAFFVKHMFARRDL